MEEVAELKEVKNKVEGTQRYLPAAAKKVEAKKLQELLKLFVISKKKENTFTKTLNSVKEELKIRTRCSPGNVRIVKTTNREHAQKIIKLNLNKV